MDSFLITGGRPLRGTVTVNGSKNACLPLMAAALLTDQPVTEKTRSNPGFNVMAGRMEEKALKEPVKEK